MTMVVGMHLGGYVLLAADTRVTRFPRGAPATWDDGHRKIHRTHLGVIAGAGSCDLLEAVERRLAGPEGNGVTCFEDMHRIVHEEREARRPDRDEDPRVYDSYSPTGWILTYLHPSDDPNEVLRMAVVHAETVETWRVPRGGASLLMPQGATAEFSGNLHAAIVENMRLQDSPEASPRASNIISP